MLLGNITYPRDAGVPYSCDVDWSNRIRHCSALFTGRYRSKDDSCPSFSVALLEKNWIGVLSCTIFTQRQLILALRHFVSSDFISFRWITSRNRFLSLGLFSWGIESIWGMHNSICCLGDRGVGFVQQTTCNYEWYVRKRDPCSRSSFPYSAGDIKGIYWPVHTSEWLGPYPVWTTMTRSCLQISEDLASERHTTVESYSELKGNRVALRDCKGKEEAASIHFLFYPFHLVLLFHFSGLKLYSTCSQNRWSLKHA